MSLDPPEYKEGEYALCKKEYNHEPYIFLPGEKYKVSPLIWNGVHYAYNIYQSGKILQQFHISNFYEYFYSKNELRKDKLKSINNGLPGRNF